MTAAPNTALPTEGFFFEQTSQDGHARTGTFTTPRAVVQTPTFMPVGTYGTVKGLSPAEVEATGARLILANTYHLWLRPGAELIDRRGGLTELLRWPHAPLTARGGCQVSRPSHMHQSDDA